MFNSTDREPDHPDTTQLKRIDRFVRNYRREWAALVWGYDRATAARGGDREYLGIDLKPTPHIITCTYAQLSNLNRTVDNRLREAIGVLDGYQPEREVLVVGIADGQIQLVVFACDRPSPEEEFAALGKSVDELLDLLEANLAQELGAQA